MIDATNFVKTRTQNLCCSKCILYYTCITLQLLRGKYCPSLVCLLSNNGRVVELVQSVEKSSQQCFRAPTRRTVKIRYKEECKNIIEFVGLTRINQKEVEALKSILR